MTDSGPVVVRQGGVVVEKSYDPEGYPVPTIEYGLRSERDDPVEVRLADTVPDDVPMEDIGFHPEYGAECWTTTSDGRIVFEREFDPDEEYITVCGLRPEHTDEIDRFLTEPVVEAEAAPGTVADAERGGGGRGHEFGRHRRRGVALDRGRIRRDRHREVLPTGGFGSRDRVRRPVRTRRPRGGPTGRGHPGRRVDGARPLPSGVRGRVLDRDR